MALHSASPTAYFTSCLICCSLHPSATFVRILPISTSMLTMETVPPSNSYYGNCHLPIFILSLIHTEQTSPGSAGHVGSARADWIEKHNITFRWITFQYQPRVTFAKDWIFLVFFVLVGTKDFLKLNVTCDFECNAVANSHHSRYCFFILLFYLDTIQLGGFFYC